MARWLYGSYEFRINPNSANSTIQLIGDEGRTLNGTLISQPTGVRKNYQIESVFYQPRTRIISEYSFVTDCFDWYNNKFYAVNKASNRIDIYNSNLTVESNITLANITNKNFKSIDVVSDGIWILCSNAGIEDYITKISFTGTIVTATKTLPVVSGNHILDIEQLNGYVFAIRAGKIEQLTLALVKMLDITLPYGTYKGLGSMGKYLIVGANEIGYGNTIYHIDIVRGRIVNSIINDQLITSNSISSDGNFIYAHSTGKMQKIQGNTTLIDYYNLENEIESYGFANLVDDTGMSKRVTVLSIENEKIMGFENMLRVSLSVEKVDRG